MLKDEPKTPSLTSQFKDGAKDTLKDVAGKVSNLVPNAFGRGDANSLDGSSNEFNRQKARVDDLAVWIKKISIDGGNESEFLNHIDIDKLKTLDANGNPDKLRFFLEEQLRRDLKILTDQVEEEERKKNLQLTENAQRKIGEGIDNVENKNINSVKYRILASLVFFGVLDCLDIVSNVLDNFGGDFSESVGKVLRDSSVMGDFAEINKAFRIDQIFEGLSKMPILNDVNQLFVDALSTEFTQPLGAVAQGLIQSDGAEFALKGVVLAYQLSQEFNLYNEYSETKNKVEEKINTVESEVKESVDATIDAVAEKIIEKQELARLDIIHLRNFLLNENSLLEIQESAGTLQQIKIKDNNGDEKSTYEWFSQLQNPANPTKESDLEKLIVLLASSENKNSLKAINNVIKNSNFTHDSQIIEEKSDILDKLITDVRYQEIKSLVIKSEKQRDPKSSFASLPDDLLKKDFCDIVASLPREDCDRIIVGVAKEIRKPEVVFNIKENLLQKSASDFRHATQGERADRHADKIMQKKSVGGAVYI